MTIPLVISVFIIFIYLLLNNYHFGSNNFKSLPENMQQKLLKKYASHYQFIKWVMFLYHLIPILLCIQALNTFKEHNDTSYLQKNVIYYINSSIILILICICFSDMKYYDNIHTHYTCTSRICDELFVTSRFSLKNLFLRPLCCSTFIQPTAHIITTWTTNIATDTTICYHTSLHFQTNFIQCTHY